MGTLGVPFHTLYTFSSSILLSFSCTPLRITLFFFDLSLSTLLQSCHTLYQAVFPPQPRLVHPPSPGCSVQSSEKNKKFRCPRSCELSDRPPSQAPGVPPTPLPPPVCLIQFSGPGWSPLGDGKPNLVQDEDFRAAGKAGAFFFWKESGAVVRFNQRGKRGCVPRTFHTFYTPWLFE
jgi:hypothetical protein